MHIQIGNPEQHIVAIFPKTSQKGIYFSLVLVFYISVLLFPAFRWTDVIFF